MKKTTAIITVLLFTSIVHAKVYSKSSQFEVDTNSLQRMHFEGLGLPRPVLKYVNASVARVKIDVVAETVFGVDELLEIPVLEKNRELYIGRTSGSYSCELRKRNGKVSHIKGSCYDRMFVFLPKNSKLEVYYRGERLTKVFVPISIEELRAQLDSESFDDKRAVRVQEFLKSYTEAKVFLHMHVRDIFAVLKEFSFSANQLEALEKLHKYAIDRENFATMIEELFWFPSDKKTARRIVGL